MIRYTQGNPLDAPVDIVVTTANEVGVMGKGLALQFEQTFPEKARLCGAAGKCGEVPRRALREFLPRERLTAARYRKLLGDAR